MGLRPRWLRVPRVYVILLVTQVPLAIYWAIVANSSTDCSSQTIGNPESLFKKEQEVTEIKASHNTQIGINIREIIISAEELTMAERDSSERLTRLENLCKKYHIGLYRRPGVKNDLNRIEHLQPNYPWFFWNRARKVGFCPVYKAGYTSWLYNMMRLAGFTEAELDGYPLNSHLRAREAYGIGVPPDKSTVESSKKLIIVRHPFERLLSAYMDKLSASSDPASKNHPYYQSYGTKIVANFRQDPSNTQLEPTWEEFISYIITLNPNKFADFDDHWLPTFLACTPCLVRWDFIAKTETYTRDQAYIIREMGLKNILKPKWGNKSPEGSNVADMDRMAKVGKQYAKLTKSQIKKLANIYLLDFLLFGYDPEDYIGYGRDE